VTAAIIPGTQDFQRIGGSLTLDFVDTVGNRKGKSRDYFTSISEVTRWARLVGLVSPRSTLSIKSSSSGCPDRHTGGTLCDIPTSCRWFTRTARGSETPQPTLGRSFPTTASRSQRKSVCLDLGHRHLGAGVSVGPILLDAADLLTSGKFTRIRQCADGICGWLFVDRSQTGNSASLRRSNASNKGVERRIHS
jgi:predicted RNA-binding Zn ribbon-like protein